MDPVSYLDILVDYAGAGHKVKFIGLDNAVADARRHMPWFAVYSASRLPVKAKPVDGVPLIYDPSSFTYKPEPSRRVYIYESASRASVPNDASRLMGRHNVKAGLFNIRYEVRVAYDFSATHHLLGVPAPLIFLRNDEMMHHVEHLLDTIANMRVMAFDIEVFSRGGGFPRRGDPVLTISYATFRLGDDIFSPDWPEKNVKVLSIPRDSSNMDADSRRLVEAFFATLESERPNVVVSYNGAAFDVPYMEPHLSRKSQYLTTRFLGVVRDKAEYYAPHIDLMLVRDSLGSAMGIRSHVAYALDDVALEVADSIKKIHDVGWLFESDYIKAERAMNPEKIKELWQRDDPLFATYAVADVYLTALVARIWLYSLLLLSALTGIPPTALQELNTGQIAEFVVVEMLRRLGFYPELRTRRLEYARTDEEVPIEDGWVFNKGKVYVRDYGFFGGNGKKIVELDFAQLYPTDMVANTADPTMVFIAGGTREGEPVQPTIAVDAEAAKRQTTVVLGVRSKKSESAISPRVVLKVVPGYGPVSWFTFKLYSMRNETKRLKEEAKRRKRAELLAPDQAVKIVNNSLYGAFSKQRGNLVNELLSATVFWRTQRILYRVIEFIDTELPKRLNAGATVLYGDTDSAYVLVDASVDASVVEREVNEFIKREFGDLYRMSLEGEYDAMLVPKQKDRDSPSAKSYICLKGGKIAKVRGEFFKLNAPVAIKDRLMDFYAVLIERRPANRDEIRDIVRDFLADKSASAWFVKKSVSSLVNEDDSRKLKRLNREQHYAALYSLYLYNAPGVHRVPERVGLVTASSRNRVRVLVDPREAERSQRAIVVHYLPHPSGDPKRFLVLAGEEGDRVKVHVVEVVKLEVRREGDTAADALEKYYDVTFTVREETLTRTELLKLVINAIEKDVVDPLALKLLPALNGNGGGARGVPDRA